MTLCGLSVHDGAGSALSEQLRASMIMECVFLFIECDAETSARVHSRLAKALQLQACSVSASRDNMMFYVSVLD